MVGVVSVGVVMGWVFRPWPVACEVPSSIDSKRLRCWRGDFRKKMTRGAAVPVHAA